MKKVIWIFSINVDGVYPFGYANMNFGPRVGLNTKEFQADLCFKLHPKIDIDFISYNSANPEPIYADLILCTKQDIIYLTEDLKEKVVCLPFQLYYSKKNIDAICEFIQLNT